MTRLTWLGHSTVLIETAGTRLLTDPLLAAGIGPVRRRAAAPSLDVSSIDGVLISHLHQDHLHLASLRRLPRGVRVIVPRGGGRLVRSAGFTDVVEVRAGDSVSVGHATVRAVPARHRGRRLPLGPSAPALGYVVDGEHRLYFAGDTDLFEGMAHVADDLDVAILPIGGWGPTLRSGHLDPARAAHALTLLRPRMAVAIHWGTLWPIGMWRVRRDRFELPAAQFIEEARRTAPSVAIPELLPGSAIDLDLPPRS